MILLRSPSFRPVSLRKPTARILSLLALAAVAWPIVARSEAPSFRRARLDDKIIVESSEASQVREIVRSQTNGIVVAQFVKPGERVKKGQVLGHVEYSNPKYQMELAKLGAESSGPLESARGQAEAWEATRLETEQAVRRRQADKARLEWADAMQRKYQGDYQTQLESQKVRKLQYEFWQDQYDRCFFKSPVDGVVTEVRAPIGTQVTHATHLFTVASENTYLLPLTVPAELAANLAAGSTLPVRSTSDGFVARGIVESLTADPKAPGKMLIRLLLDDREVPFDSSSKVSGSKFDVLLPASPDEGGISHLTQQSPPADVPPVR